MALQPTPHQTIGPFFGFALPYEGGAELVDPADPEAIRIRGTVRDGSSEPVGDAMLEIWQADPAGRYPAPTDRRANGEFGGFGRVQTAEDGGFTIVTVKPGAVAGPNGVLQAPHLLVGIFARGILKHLVTRIYFPGDPAALAADPVLSRVESDRRQLLVAEPAGDALRFDIHLQGDLETPFLEL
jgi:protocatechuate 3,4-dioxygenase, alpha subunit